MAALHDALKTLGPIDFEQTNLDDLKPFLSDAFSNAQLIVDSVPIPAPSGASSPETGRSRSASSASEISLSSARPASPPADVEALQKEWKQVKLNAKDNPLGMSVYKASGKDGKGAWFARRSVHEGLGFTKWRKGLEREFPETMKVQGNPGEGNIRGIGGERRVAYKNVEGVGKMEGKHLYTVNWQRLTSLSISAFSSISWPYDSKRLCHHVPYFRSSVVRYFGQGFRDPTPFHGHLKAL